MHKLISPLPFLLFMGISLAVGFTGAANKKAIETCQERGGSIDECHLIVLGRSATTTTTTTTPWQLY